MRLLGLLKKTAIENIRDWKILVLTLVFAPFFLGLMYLYFENETVKTYHILVMNQDAGTKSENQSTLRMGNDLIARLKSLATTDGQPVLKIREVADETSGMTELKNRGADLLIKIPANFSGILSRYRKGNNTQKTTVRTIGDPSNGKYMMAAVWCDMTVYQFVQDVAGDNIPLVLMPRTVGGQHTDSLSDFQLYVPGMLVMALVMIMFTAAASLIKEKDTGTIIRLRLSGTPPFQWYLAVTIIQVIIGLLAIGLTLLTAMALGYQISTSPVALAVTGLLSSLSIMAISLVVSAYLRTIFDLMTIGCLPFFILLFFSGAIFPLPKLQIFSLGTHPVHINDILPVTHSIEAFNRILNHHGTMNDVMFEWAAITILTIMLFLWGAWLFSKRHLRPH
jgi:ABC-2 type transport system permease protein